MKDSLMARYCHDCTFLEGGSLKQHEEFQINQLMSSILQIYIFFVNFIIMEFLKLSYISFDKYFFIILP